MAFNRVGVSIGPRLVKQRGIFVQDGRCCFRAVEPHRLQTLFRVIEKSYEWGRFFPMALKTTEQRYQEGGALKLIEAIRCDVISDRKQVRWEREREVLKRQFTQKWNPDLCSSSRQNVYVSSMSVLDVQESMPLQKMACLTRYFCLVSGQNI